ncbi:MAG: TRAP transporter TatT component family protein [Vicinamibacterales bacterium]
MSPSLSPAVMAGTALDAPRQAQVPPDPDRLYADREHLASAEAAAHLWADRLARDPADFEAAWKLARARYWLGTNGLPAKAARKDALEAGIAAGRRAAAARPDRPEGHFWIAANMGALAESFGLRQGLRYRGAIRDELERVLALDPAYLQGSADRALGRWYYKVPGLFGGSKERSEAHLRAALAYAPDSIITRVFLAETLIARDKDDEARAQLRAAIAATPDPDWAPEDRRFQAEARALLATLGGR